MKEGLRLALWLRDRVHRRGEQIDHLKLQKLVFYGYGATCARGIEPARITFQAWKHGPVNVDVWQAHKQYGADPIPSPIDLFNGYSAEVVAVLDDVLDVYGRLSSWQIRCETHTEAPWREAYARGARTEIGDDALRAHFRAKYAEGQVRAPVYLGGSANAAVDGIPAATFPSLHAVAEALRRRRPRA